VLLQTTTDAAGAYEIIRGAGRVQTNRQWYVTAGATRSRTLSQGVEAIVRLTAAAAKGPRRTFSGHVTPSHEGERILLQRLIAHGWSTIARPRLTRTSSFGATLRLAKGTSELRAVLPADERNLRSASRPVSVRTQ
jgi:hypothetical protein